MNRDNHKMVQRLMFASFFDCKQKPSDGMVMTSIMVANVFTQVVFHLQIITCWSLEPAFWDIWLNDIINIFYKRLIWAEIVPSLKTFFHSVHLFDIF